MFPSLLPTAKIRRLYDVANVLVSVGLIEKLQLSNSRKPVFRWRNRSPSEIEQQSELIEGELVFQVKQEALSQVDESLEDGEVEIKAETLSSPIDLQCEEVIDGPKTSQSCDSDSFDDGSDSQSDWSSNGTPKRKYAECGSSTSPVSSDDDMALKRSKTEETPPPSSSSSSPSNEEASTESPPQSTTRLLRFDASSAPVHPQIVLHEQQEHVRIYMQQYIREYVDHLIVQQARVDPSLATVAGTVAASSASGLVTEGSRSIAESSVATITQSIHGTPVTMPSLTNRVTSDLVGSMDLLFSTNTTSPQSVADLIPVENRAATKNAPFVTISPVRSPPLVQDSSSPSAVVAVAGVSPPLSTCPPLAPVKSVAAKAIDVHDQPRKLLAELQSTTVTTAAPAATQS